jgi:hypothetical protein
MGVGDEEGARMAHDSAMARATTTEERTRIGTTIEPFVPPSRLSPEDSTSLTR